MLSTEKVFIISVATAIDALPEIGLIIAKGSISEGKFIILNNGVIIFTIKSIIPELLNNPIATNNPTKVGNILKTIPTPSFAPSKNTSKTFFL